jgi:hypothetical protein
MTRAANVSKEVNRLRNEANQFAAETLRPAALALDRMNDPKRAIAGFSALAGLERRLFFAVSRRGNAKAA